MTIFSCVGCMDNGIIDLGKEIYDESTKPIEDTTEQLESLYVQSYNAQFISYTGESIRGVTVKALIKKVVVSNQLEEGHVVKIEYISENNSEDNITATNDSNQLENLDNSIVKNNKYKVEISEYDKEGFVSVIKITELKLEE